MPERKWASPEHPDVTLHRQTGIDAELTLPATRDVSNQCSYGCSERQVVLDGHAGHPMPPLRPRKTSRPPPGSGWSRTGVSTPSGRSCRPDGTG
jgi:hypothetical protein